MLHLHQLWGLAIQMATQLSCVQSSQQTREDRASLRLLYNVQPQGPGEQPEPTHIKSPLQQWI